MGKNMALTFKSIQTYLGIELEQNGKCDMGKGITSFDFTFLT